MLTGTIKFFNKSKGFGFITSDAGGKEVFLPSATVTASGLKKVEPGQRVSFEEQADVKGPKAIVLALLDEPRRAPPPPPAPQPAQGRPATAAAATLYCDPTARSFEAVRDALAAEKLDVALVDVTATPPEPAELKKWSLALSNSDIGLVRRSDPLFFALQLDDRFISESDFWLAISQHPTLINGPVVKAGNKLAICKSAEDVRRLLGAQGAPTAQKPKGISARLSALMRGEALPPIEEDDEEEEDEIEEMALEAAPATVEAGTKTDAKPVKAAARKAVAKPKPAPAKKAVAKAKAAPAKKAAAKKR